MRDVESTSSSSPLFTLWLHVLSFLSTAYPLSKSAASKRTGTGAGAGGDGQGQGQGHLTVKGRLRVAEHVDIDLNNIQRAINPKLLRLLLQRDQSWRLYISWYNNHSHPPTCLPVRTAPYRKPPTYLECFLIMRLNHLLLILIGYQR